MIYSGQYKTSVKGKNLCKVCGHPFGTRGLKKGEDRKYHECHLVAAEGGVKRREAFPNEGEGLA